MQCKLNYLTLLVVSLAQNVNQCLLIASKSLHGFAQAWCIGLRVKALSRKNGGCTLRWQKDSYYRASIDKETSAIIKTQSISWFIQNFTFRTKILVERRILRLGCVYENGAEWFELGEPLRCAWLLVWPNGALGGVFWLDWKFWSGG